MLMLALTPPIDAELHADPECQDRGIESRRNCLRIRRALE
jgi:hypothetical protein